MGEGLGGDDLGKLMRLACVGLLLAVIASASVSCRKTGGGTAISSPEAEVAVRAVEAATSGEYQDFIYLVDPGFVETATRETGLAPGAELGRVLSLRFAEKHLPPGLEKLRRVESEFLPAGERGTALIWGEMVLEGGNILHLPREEAVRIPLVRRGECWFVDMLRS